MNPGAPSELAATTVDVPSQLASFLERTIHRAGLASVYEKVADGRRLDREDALKLYETRDINALGALANWVRERKVGNIAYFNRNLRIDYTNICNKQCLFCAFDRLPGEPGGYVLTEDDIRRRLDAHESVHVTEVHIVGGINPKLPFEYYLELLRTVKRLRPEIHIKAFTMVELAQMIRVSRLSAEETIAALREAGLGSCPGGGAEILSDRVHRQLHRLKIGPKDWLALQRTAHLCGLRSTATMLYGHIETVEERIDHMLQLRELQDETGGFFTFIPLSFHPTNTELSHIRQATGLEDLRNIAIARLLLDNFDHIKAYWIMLTQPVTQMCLHYGSDDVDGTVLEETIVHEAGAQTPTAMTVAELTHLIRETGRVPVERDTLYNVLKVYN